MECHFTWALDFSDTTFPRLRQHLWDINPQEGHPWLASIHNLQGFISFQLKANQDALESFQTAAEAFRRAADEGPCLLVTYGNLAWLHHHLGNGEQSQAYLSRVRDLMETHPPPSQDELHPEVYAERAWTLMSISVHHQEVGPYFLRAMARRPDVVAWNSSYVVWLFSGTELGEELPEELRRAKERDPENAYLAVRCLNVRAKRGERLEDDARGLADRIMAAPLTKYSGIKALLWIFSQHICAEEAMVLAENFLHRHPQHYYARKCAAQCYRWSLSSPRLPSHVDSLQVRTRAIELHRDLIQRYPKISAVTKLELAGLYATVDLRRAEEQYKELLHHPNPGLRQKIYHKYAYFLFYQKHDGRNSARYHMEAVKIPKQSVCRTKSYIILDLLRRKQLFPRLRLEQFLRTVPPPEDQPQRDDRV